MVGAAASGIPAQKDGTGLWIQALSVLRRRGAGGRLCGVRRVVCGAVHAVTVSGEWRKPPSAGSCTGFDRSWRSREALREDG